MTTRSELMTAFVANSGWAAADRVLVAGDASNRRYERLSLNGQSVILMDAPPDKGEDIRPFIQIAEHLTQIGLSAPRILHTDLEAGFLLLEDLGDDLFARVVVADPSKEDQIYRAATEVLVKLHQAPLPDIKVYGPQIMTDMAALSYRWYALHGTGHDVTDQQRAFEAAFLPILKAHTGGRQVLIQRDYHAENLLWLPDRTGVARVGLLDFQDAMLGHPAYDLVSVLQDARRDVPLETEEAMIAHYIDLSGADADEFRTAYAVLGVQRNLRILGVFARLCIKNGKASYVDLIPRVWGLLHRNLDHPAVTPVADMILRDLPAPSASVLERVKAKCGDLLTQ